VTRIERAFCIWSRQLSPWQLPHTLYGVMRSSLRPVHPIQDAVCSQRRSAPFKYETRDGLSRSSSNRVIPLMQPCQGKSPHLSRKRESYPCVHSIHVLAFLDTTTNELLCAQLCTHQIPSLSVPAATMGQGRLPSLPMTCICQPRIIELLPSNLPLSRQDLPVLSPSRLQILAGMKPYQGMSGKLHLLPT
jgi:hypothetical protein